MLENDILRAYENLSVATIDAYHAGEDAITAKNILERRKLAGLADGTIEGKNTDLREAAARIVLEVEYANAEATDDDARLTRHDLDLARIEVERVRAMLRLHELRVAQLAQSGDKPPF